MTSLYKSLQKGRLLGVNVGLKFYGFTVFRVWGSEFWGSIP